MEKETELERDLRELATRLARQPGVPTSVAYDMAREVWGLWWKHRARGEQMTVAWKSERDLKWRLAQMLLEVTRERDELLARHHG